MTGSTRDAYGSLQRLQEDTAKDIRAAWVLVATATPAMTMDQLAPAFAQALVTLSAGCRELRADLDLLTDPGSEQ